MLITKLHLGDYGTNGYLITDDERTEAAFVDCGFFEPSIVTLLKSKGITQLKYILLTHGHFDHICGVYDLKKSCGGRVYIHQEDAECLTDELKSMNAVVNYAVQTPLKADGLLNEGDTLTLGKEKITVLHTPGHTKGSVCFLSGNVLFSGDTLFAGTIGRTDFPGGNAEEMKHSLKRLAELPEDTLVYPGHNQNTTIQNEKNHNPFLR